MKSSIAVSTNAHIYDHEVPSHIIDKTSFDTTYVTLTFGSIEHTLFFVKATPEELQMYAEMFKRVGEELGA